MRGATVKTPRLARVASVALACAVAGCVPQSAPPASVGPPRPASNVRELPARPRVAFVVREGDPRAGIAVAVLTRGVDDSAGPRVPVALAAITEARLATLHDVSVAATWDGYRVRALLPPNGESTAVVKALRDALLAPLTASDLEAARRKLTLLGRRPLHDPALEDAARCAEEPWSVDSLDTPPPAPPSMEALERWRASSHGLGRVVFGVTGSAKEVDAIASVILDQPTWPTAAARVAPAPRTAQPLRVYDATLDVATGAGAAARVTVVVHTPDAATAVAASSLLGAKNGPLATRLRAVEPAAVVREVTATAQADGGCVDLSFDLPRDAHDSRGDDGNAALATTVAVVRQEALESVRPSSRPRDISPAALAGDPREAAELAAWWALVAESSAPAPAVTESVVVGVAAEPNVDLATRTKALSAAVERATTAWQTPTIEARHEVEPGQGAITLLLASPCGTLAEGDADAGLSALSVASLVEAARESSRDPEVDLSEWVAPDGVGLFVRVARREGESGVELARRAANIVGSVFAASVDSAAIERSRAGLLTLASRDDSHAFGTLAEALVPGHASWTLPWVNGLAGGRGIEAPAEGAVVSRLAGLRREPLRLAVLGNEDAAQVDAAVQAVDRWIPTRGPRACPAPASPDLAKPGTYAAPSSRGASAWLALPLPRPSRGATRDAAIAVAAALDGPDGLLAHALSSGLASSWSAKVVGSRDAAALAIHVASPGPTLDSAVAQVRGLLDRLHHGALTEADHTRAAARIGDEDLAATLSPRGRVERLWRGEPKTTAVATLDAMRGFAESTLHDEALVIVAARPPLAKATP